MHCISQQFRALCQLPGQALLSYVDSAHNCSCYGLQAIKALTAALAPKARAIRDGKLEQVDAADLVPGDIVLIAIGNIIPADLKLLGEEGDDVPMQVTVGEHCGGKAQPQVVML